MLNESTSLSTRKLVALSLKDVLYGEYNYDATTGKITYANPGVMGAGITAACELRFAEGRLYASGALKRYRKKLTGGSLSFAVESLSLAVQKSLYKAADDATEIASGAEVTPKTINGIGYGEDTRGRYIGISTYMPADSDDDTDACICLFVRKSMLGPPAMNYNTASDSITWSTPTTTGEFLTPDHLDGVKAPLMLSIAETDNEDDALAWCKAKLGWTEASA